MRSGPAGAGVPSVKFHFSFRPLFVSGLLRAAVLVSLLAGCTAGSRSVSYEVTSPAASALKAVDDAPSSFTVPYSEEHFASERMRYFFRTILKGDAHQAGVNTVTGEATITGGSENYVYRIQKRPSSEGILYSVTCIPRSSPAHPDDAERNAHNLARFISTGTFEKKALAY